MYTKNPGWREQVHHALNNGKSKKTPEVNPGEGTTEGETRKAKEVIQGLEEKVQSWIGSGKFDK